MNEPRRIQQKRRTSEVRSEKESNSGKSEKGKGSTRSKTYVKPTFSDEDSDLNDRKWRLNSNGYAVITLNNNPVLAHHIVCIRAFGHKPDWSIREVTDHINRNKLDNRRENLRICSITENMRNRDYPKSRSEFPHATLHKIGKWQSYIFIKGKGYYLGLFTERREASDTALKFRENFKEK